MEQVTDVLIMLRVTNLKTQLSAENGRKKTRITINERKRITNDKIRFAVVLVDVLVKGGTQTLYLVHFRTRILFLNLLYYSEVKTVVSLLFVRLFPMYADEHDFLTVFWIILSSLSLSLSSFCCY